MGTFTCNYFFLFSFNPTFSEWRWMLWDTFRRIQS